MFQEQPVRALPYELDGKFFRLRDVLQIRLLSFEVEPQRLSFTLGRFQSEKPMSRSYANASWTWTSHSVHKIAWRGTSVHLRSSGGLIPVTVIELSVLLAGAADADRQESITISDLRRIIEVACV